MKRTMLGRAPTTSMITGSIAVAFVLEMLPWGGFPAPDFLALILVFWNIFQPRRVGIALAWLQLLPLFFLAKVIVVLVHLFFSGVGPTWTFFVSPLLTAALWLPMTIGILNRLNRPQSSTAAIGR